MGRYGQAILTIAGTIVGAYFGYPALGATLGSLAGSLLFPTQLPTVSGPRLADLTQTTASVGGGIPRGWGTFSVAGTVIYQSDLREVIVREEVGGKGGAEQTVETPTYYQDFAIALCEGEDPIANLQPIAGVRRIWANGKCIYDRRPQSGESSGDFNMRIAASDALDAAMTIYLGTEDQMPDPTIEADKGVGNVSAFRGVAYVVFTNWQNKPEDGNKMPINWKFEVYTSGTIDIDDGFEYSNEYLPPWGDGDIPLRSTADYVFTVPATGRTFGSGRFRVEGSFSSLGQAQSAAENVGERTADNYMGYSITPHAGTHRPRGRSHFVYSDRTVGRYDAYRIVLLFNHMQADEFGDSIDGLGEAMAQGLAPGVNVHSTGYFLDANNSRTSAGVYQWWPADYWSGVAYKNSQIGIDKAITTGRSEDPGAVLITGDVMIEVRRLTMPPNDQCAAETPELPGYCVSYSGNLVQTNAWEYIDAGVFQQPKVLQKFSTKRTPIPGAPASQDVTEVIYPLNPCLPYGHSNYDNQAFWENAYALAVAQGVMPAGLVYDVDYPETQNFYYRRAITQTTVSTNPVPLSDVVRDLMREAGYADADFNVTALASKTVLGYVRTRVMSGRAAIEPLRQAKFFDGIESAGIVKFVNRGGPIVSSLTDDELGVAVQGEDPPSKLTTTTADETTLPRSVRVHYLAVSRDYEPGEQSSPPRVETRATNDVDIDLPMVLSDTEAAQIAEVLWSEAWTGRRTHSAVIDAGRQELEPTDPIEIPVDGRTRRVRILSIEDSLPALRRLEMMRDDDGSYISRAVGTTPGYVRPTLTVPSPAELILLDLPPLRDEDDDAGVYAAVRPYLTDVTFNGATILRSSDGGASYQSLGPVGTAVPVGYLVQAPEAGPWTIWDEEGVLLVQMQYGTLESRTTAAVLSGANAAAIGAHGRWEIVQFRDAVHLGDGLWELSGLLRGRRGTEHNIGTAVTDDRFVMLSTGGLIRLPLNVSEIGASRLYKCVAVGTAFGDAPAQEFTGEGEALKPFSPVHVKAYRQDDGDLLITWIRRGRIGQTLQSGTDVALSEETEAYSVDILVDGEVVETINTTVQQATYTAAAQAEDLDSPPPASIDVEVYQISATVGRGHPGELEVVLADVESEGGGVEVPPDELTQPDADAIIVPLIYDEENEALSPLTWTRSGDGPRLTDVGMVGDGYEARLTATSGLPAFVTSSSGSLYLRATIAAFDCGARNSTADRVVSICENDATANPRLEFAIVDDSNASNEPNVALRAYTGSMQTKKLSRREWKFAFTYPEKTRGGYEVRPQGLLVQSDGVLLCEHYEEQFSTCHKVGFDGAEIGSFEFAAGLIHMGAIADQESDGGIWFSENDTRHLLKVDIEASLLSQSAVVLADVDLTGLDSTASIEWVVVDEVEYLLVGEYTSGRIYLFDGADVVDGAVLGPADRIKRMAGPANNSGMAYRLDNGTLCVAVFGSGSQIIAIDLPSWIATGTDDESYSGYEMDRYGAPSSMVEDLDFDEAGDCWMSTEGRDAAFDDTDWYAVWVSPLDGTNVGNTFSAYYNSGSVRVRINDREFCTLAWTPTATPAAIAIGGPPAASASQSAGFFDGLVRNVLIQSTDYDVDDWGGEIVYETDGFAIEHPLTIENAGAEDGTADWTNETGVLDVGTGGPGPYEGAAFFFGGTSPEVIARQRLDLAAQFDFDLTRLDDGDCWVLCRWHGASFTGQADSEQIGVRFLNASQVQIGSDEYADPLAVRPALTWIPRSYGITIPAGTRYIDVLMRMVRDAGFNNDGYIDAIEASVFVPVPNE